MSLSSRASANHPLPSQPWPCLCPARCGRAAAGTLLSCSAHCSLHCLKSHLWLPQNVWVWAGPPCPEGRTLLSCSPHPAGVQKAPARQLSGDAEPDQKFIQLRQTQPINC